MKIFSFLISAQIRRLYDIANILTSLDLICKVRVTEMRGRKPAFKYVGPTVMDNPENLYAIGNGIELVPLFDFNDHLKLLQDQEICAFI